MEIGQVQDADQGTSLLVCHIRPMRSALPAELKWPVFPPFFLREETPASW